MTDLCLLSEFETIRYSTSETVEIDLVDELLKKRRIVTEYNVD